jgi:3-methyl-2-oxobutanoate hydroxymethyltransferase
MDILDHFRSIIRQRTERPVIVELGACDGYHTSLLSIEALTARAGSEYIALEPIPELCEMVRRRTHGVTVIQKAVGAGNGTAGQVLVLHDMLGLNLGKMPKFVRNFMQDANSIRGAMEAYVAAVKNASFPDNALHAW